VGDYTDQTRRFTEVLRFGTQIILHTKRTKEGREKVKPDPIQVRFHDGARWPADSQEDAQSLARSLVDSIRSALDPHVRELKSRFATIVAQENMNEGDASEAHRLAQWMAEASKNPVLSQQEGDQWYVGLDGGWVVFCEDANEAQELSEQVHESLSWFRKRQINRIRLEIVAKLRRNMEGSP